VGLLRKFLDNDIKYYGLDFIDKYKNLVPNSFCLDISKERVPVSDNFFDNVCLLEILEHISNFFSAFEEVYRILKPGGRVIITVQNNFNLPQSIGTIKYGRYLKRNLDLKRVENFDTHIHSFFETDFLKISQMISFKQYIMIGFLTCFIQLSCPKLFYLNLLQHLSYGYLKSNQRDKFNKRFFKRYYSYTYFV